MTATDPKRPVAEIAWQRLFEDRKVSREVLRAILKNNIENLDAFKQQGIDLTEVSEKEGWSYLHKALLSERMIPSPVVILYLIELGNDVNAIDIYGNTPLHYAARIKDPKVLKVLIDANADVNIVNKDGISPLRQALVKKPCNYESIRLLLESGADKEQKVEGGITIREFVDIIGHSDAKLIDLFNSLA